MAELNYNDLTAAGGDATTNVQAGEATTIPNYTTPNVQTQPAAVPMTSLEPAQPIKVPLAPPQVNPAAQAVASAGQTSKSLQEYIKELTPEVTALDAQQSRLISSIQGLLPETTGRGQAQLTGETQAGIPQLKTQLSDLNAQILTKSAEANQAQAAYDKLIASYETQPGMLSSIVMGQQGAAQRLQLADARTRSAEISLLQARALGLQGNLNAAQDNVNRAVDLRYQDKQDELNLREKQLEMLAPLLDKQEKVQATALQRKYTEDQARIAEEKSKAKENINLAFSANVQTQFVNRNGEFFDARTGQPYPDPASFFKAAGVKSFEEAYKRGLVTDVTPARLADLEFVTQARNNYKTAGITLNDTPETAVEKIKRTDKYRKENYIAPVGGGGPKAGSLGATHIVDADTDAKVKALIASRPGDGEYGNAYDAVKKQYGKAIADAYDKVYQGVFNGGQSVDAAFNNAKLGSNGIDSAGGLGDYDILAEAVSNKIGSVSSKNSFLTQYKKATTDEQRIKILAANVVLPTEVKNGIIQNTQVTKSLEDVLSMLDRGVQTGLLQAGQSYIANKTGTGGDKEVEAIKSKLVTAVQPYRNKVTGAAWGDQEEAEYQALIGSVKFSPDDLRNKLNVFKDTLKQQSQTALLAGIDPLGAVNSNSFIQDNPSLGGTGLAAQVTARGYDYQKMRDDGNSDEEIKAALGL